MLDIMGCRFAISSRWTFLSAAPECRTSSRSASAIGPYPFTGGGLEQ